jgi:pSer/pThr/pTyr-binding forkhead associated (FHA) protein
MDLTGPHSASASELKARLELEREGAPFLILRDGAARQRLVVLDAAKPRLTIGRSNQCDLALTWDEQVSRVHAELVRIGPGWALDDSGLSRNGSFLNGERVAERRRLSDSDTLTFGSCGIVYREPRASLSVQRTVTATDLQARLELTSAQRAVLRALCRPFATGSSWSKPATNAAICAELFLSVDAVKGHLRVLFAKFGVETLPQNEKRLRLAERALTSGSVTVAELQDADPTDG